MGVGLDGDGDRLVMVDGQGNILDGDDCCILSPGHDRKMAAWKEL